MDAVQPYVKSTQIFNCPSQASYQSGYGAYEVQTGTSYGSYAINATYWGTTDNISSPAGEFVSSAAAAVPSTTVWVADGNGPFEVSWELLGQEKTITSTNPRTLDNFIERHLDTTSVLYLDGHVKSVKFDALPKRRTATNDGYAPFTLQDD